MFFFAGLDAKTVAKYLELRKIAEDKKHLPREEKTPKAKKMKVQHPW